MKRSTLVVAMVALLALALAGCADGSALGGPARPQDDALGRNPGGDDPTSGTDDLAEDADDDGKDAPDDDASASKKAPKVTIQAKSCVDSKDPLCDDPRIMRKKNLTVVTWSLKNVSAGFIKINPYAAEADPFTYTAFIGDANQPHLGAKGNPSEDTISIVEDLLSLPLEKFGMIPEEAQKRISADTEALPFNYCSTKTPSEKASCYEGGGDPANYLHVFFPLRKNETSRHGKWLVSTNNGVRGFKAFYRDALTGGIHAVRVKIN